MLYPCFIHPTTRSISYIRISVYLFRHAIFSILFYHTGRVLLLPTFSVFPAPRHSQPVIKLCQCFSTICIEVIFLCWNLPPALYESAISHSGNERFIDCYLKSRCRTDCTPEKTKAFFRAEVPTVFLQFSFIPGVNSVIR